jgi:hypothetical protein
VGPRVIYNVRARTCKKKFLSGGHEHGILTTWPAAFVIPSQSPVPVGFTPAWTPNAGTSAGSTLRFTGTAYAVAMRQNKAESASFIIAGIKNDKFKSCSVKLERVSDTSCVNWSRCVCGQRWNVDSVEKKGNVKENEDERER